MASKSSAAISSELRKKIKKLAAILDKSQGEIIAQAIQDYEKKILSTEETQGFENNDFSVETQVQLQLKKATQIIYQKSPEKRKRDLQTIS